MSGPLAGIRIIEIAGIGPGPFCGMMLADHGARVIRIERPGTSSRFGDGGNRDILNRNRERIELDLKDPAAIAVGQVLAATDPRFGIAHESFAVLEEELDRREIRTVQGVLQE